MENTKHNSKPLIFNRQTKVTANDAKKILEDGNNRFHDNRTLPKDTSKEKRKKLFDEGQKPFAVIVGCSDSRVSPELIFDLGLGDIFVIRSAGNLVDNIALGSIEFAIQELHVPLIVVLGHEGCGAVEATVKAVEGDSGVSSHLSAIVERICPCVEKCRAIEKKGNSSLMNLTIRENIRATVTEILTRSPIISKSINDGRISVVGAKYNLESGKVEFLDISNEKT